MMDILQYIAAMAAWVGVVYPLLTYLTGG
jgi:hypothetical protein